MHSTTTSGILKSEVNDTLPQIPEDLQQYLITTEKPQEIYNLAERERDRRVRLLLRRFTNQIQYGCTNPRCNVPTCLSYRKRASSGPLRPHTDLTARALAVKCLEQYATYGRDLGRYHNRDKGKRKQSIPEADGLCWNEPVIPWYTDPNEYLAKRNVVVRKKSTERRSPSAPTSRKVVSATTTSIPTTGRLDNGNGTSPGFPEGNSEAESRPSRQPSPGSMQESNGVLASYSEPIPKHTTEEFAHANGHISQPDDSKTTPRQRHDQASLAQSLFKHPKLQLLDELPVISSLSHKHAIEKSDDDSSAINPVRPPDTKSTSLAMGLLHSSQSVVTFRVLPSKAIQWFRRAFTEHREKDGVVPEYLHSFLNQSLYFVLSDPKCLLRSASTWDDQEPQKRRKNCSNNVTDSQLILPSPENVIRVCVTIAQCFEGSPRRYHITTWLLQALRHCYRLPHYIEQPNNSTLNIRRRHSFLSNSEVAHLILLILSMIPSIEVLFSSGQRRRDHEPLKYGDIDPYDVEVDTGSDVFQSVVQSIEWEFTPHERFEETQYHTDICLLRESIADLISHRIAIDSATESLASKPVDIHRSQGIVNEMISLMQSSKKDDSASSLGRWRAWQVVNAMKSVVLAKWDRKPVIRRTGPIGGALLTLKGLFIRGRDVQLHHTNFYLREVPAALDEVEMPYDWLSFKPDATKMHILQFPFLFPPEVVVRYFRSLNLKVMKQSHEKAMAVYANGKAQLLHGPWTVANIDEVLDSTRAHMARYFVMTIRRSHILEDAIGQIWQRERQELLRPLKVTLGKDEGENGLDHGGVQQEFFRLVFAEAFDPQYGMFDVDSTIHMAWFKPGSLEPLYKYEALGILMSLAIYNGVTLPITMPLAFYRKILGLRVKTIDHIQDGWPEIAKSFKQLLAWDDGDVEDVMALNYEFSYNAFGATITIDMSRSQPSGPKPTNMKSSSKGKEKAIPAIETELQKNGNTNHKTTTFDFSDPNNDSDSSNNITTSSASPPTPTPVTNTNRQSFVQAYITHLTTTTINAQFTSFLRGLHTLLSPQALSLFTPNHLKLLFEGHPSTTPLTPQQWRMITKYEDYTPSDPLITWFWEILEQDLTQTQLRKLLEFVTASGRLPVSGWEGVTFIVQRNGGGDERLPGSSTCYGRLLLPEYSCKEVLRERLVKAVEEGLGFGMI